MCGLYPNKVWPNICYSTCIFLRNFNYSSLDVSPPRLCCSSVAGASKAFSVGISIGCGSGKPWRTGHMDTVSRGDFTNRYRYRLRHRYRDIDPSIWLTPSIYPSIRERVQFQNRENRKIPDLDEEKDRSFLPVFPLKLGVYWDIPVCLDKRSNFKHHSISLFGFYLNYQLYLTTCSMNEPYWLYSPYKMLIQEDSDAYTMHHLDATGPWVIPSRPVVVVTIRPLALPWEDQTQTVVGKSCTSR